MYTSNKIVTERTIIKKHWYEKTYDVFLKKQQGVRKESNFPIAPSEVNDHINHDPENKDAWLFWEPVGMAPRWLGSKDKW